MDELKQVELETARLKLARERMAYEDELKKRERTEQAKETAVGVTVVAIKQAWPKIWRWAVYLTALFTGLVFLPAAISK